MKNIQLGSSDRILLDRNLEARHVTLQVWITEIELRSLISISDSYSSHKATVLIIIDEWLDLTAVKEVVNSIPTWNSEMPLSYPFTRCQATISSPHTGLVNAIAIILA